jgi:integrase
VAIARSATNIRQFSRIVEIAGIGGGNILMPEAIEPAAKILHFVESASEPKKKGVAHPRNRVQDHLTDAEMEQLIDAASRGRHGIRDACMVRLAWGHGLRVRSSWAYS